MQYTKFTGTDSVQARLGGSFCHGELEREGGGGMEGGVNLFWVVTNEAVVEKNNIEQGLGKGSWAGSS